MDIDQIIQELKAERDRLDAAIALLQGDTQMIRTGARHMSAAARARISAGQRRRWAARKAGAEAANPSSAGARGLQRSRRGHMSAVARARIAAAQKARWAKIKAQKKK